MKYLIILTLFLVVGCGPFGMMRGIEQNPDGAWGYFFGNSDPDWDFWDDPLRQRQQCKNLKEGEHCMDLTERMGGMEGTIFKELDPIKGWRQIGCIHSKQLDPSTVIEQMYCEYCNEEDHQMWMVYDYGDETWTMDDQEWLDVCGTPHPTYKYYEQQKS